MIINGLMMFKHFMESRFELLATPLTGPYFIGYSILVIIIWTPKALNDKQLKWRQELSQYAVKFVIFSILHVALVVMYQSNVLIMFSWNLFKIMLYFIPVHILLPLHDVPERKPHITTIMNLYDGIQMLQMLGEDTNDVIPVWMQIAIGISSTMFIAASFVDIYHKEDEREPLTCQCVKINSAFKLVLNFLFLLLRLIFLLVYHKDGKIFIAKNTIVLFMQASPYLQKFGCIVTGSKSKLVIELPVV